MSKEKTAKQHWDYVVRTCGPQRFIGADGMASIEAALSPKKEAPKPAPKPAPKKDD